MPAITWVRITWIRNCEILEKVIEAPNADEAKALAELDKNDP